MKLSHEQYTPASNPSDANTIIVNTCPQKTLQSMRINHAWKGQLSNLIHTTWQGRCSCAHQTNFTSPFQYKTNRRPTTSLSSHLLGCLVRDSNYGLWPVTVCSTCFGHFHAHHQELDTIQGVKGGTDQTSGGCSLC